MTASRNAWTKKLTGKTHSTKSKYGNVRVGSHDSKLEIYFKSLLVTAGIPFLEKQSVELQPPFTYMGEKVQSIKIEPDFFIYAEPGDVLLDCFAIVDTKHITGKVKNKDGSVKEIKGTAEWRMKIKMLKHRLAQDEESILFHFPTNKKECQIVLLKLIEERQKALENRPTKQ